MLRAENGKSAPSPNPDLLVRGGFTDEVDGFWVYALSAASPDAFQVCANGNQADIVLIVSGLHSGLIHATWGEGWRSRSVEWREWAKGCAMHVFANGSLLKEPQTGARKVRFCDG
ncbi:hypothetical protein [Glycomyces niveus]|uniref:Uncharacterized protein n=1 Tax=Glycomyces niveus TaxID=2820287 RepID=A0ABS3TXU7_9ACTN|nr:hypothetical protein [Glycomyces sp. NEAU-S30]MBO3731340.1 hypothetical protein [Glycomyces sp. NEAU-S30]